MNVIGIDASLTGTAACRIDSDSQGDHEMKVFRSPPASSLRGRIERYHKLVEEVERWTWQAGETAVVFIEGYSFASPQFAHQLGEYGGLLRAGLLKLVAEVIEVPPSSLKKFITGSGNAKKEQVIAHICRRWKHIFDTNDEADAFGLVQFGLRYLGLAECDSNAQREVIEKLKNPAAKKSKKRKAVEA